jgi:hypothetical protein
LESGKTRHFNQWGATTHDLRVRCIAHRRIFVESNDGDASRDIIEQTLEADIAPEHILGTNDTRLMVDATDIGQMKECRA